MHERITSFETPITKAAFQLRQVCRNIEVRPISLWDSEYGCAKFVQLTADINADKIMRLRPNRCVWGAPPPYGGKGRPKKHGQKPKARGKSTGWEKGKKRNKKVRYPVVKKTVTRKKKEKKEAA